MAHHTFNEKLIHPITHNYIPHTRTKEQTLSNTPKPIPSTPLLLPPDQSSTRCWRHCTEPQGLFWFLFIVWLVISPKFGFWNFDGFGLFFGYQSVHNGMGFVDLVWILLFLLGSIFMGFGWIQILAGIFGLQLNFPDLWTWYNFLIKENQNLKLFAQISWTIWHHRN